MPYYFKVVHSVQFLDQCISFISSTKCTTFGWWNKTGYLGPM